MRRVTIRIRQRDGCEMLVVMPENDYEYLIERWLELCFGGPGERIEIPGPPPPGEATPALVSVPVSEIQSIEALMVPSADGPA